MSAASQTRALPAQPSLEHLRKEAKARLEELQARAPRLRLADAQFALARDYGFPSWRALKQHVEEAGPPSPAQAGPMPMAALLRPSAFHWSSGHFPALRNATDMEQAFFKSMIVVMGAMQLGGALTGLLFPA